MTKHWSENFAWHLGTTVTGAVSQLSSSLLYMMPITHPYSLWNLRYYLWMTIFDRNPFQSSTSSDHPCLLLYLLYYLYLRLMFSAIIFKFYSVWWQFSLFEYEQISWHNSFTFFLQINDQTNSLSKPITFCARSSVLQGFPTVGVEGKCPLCTASQLKNKPKIFISKLDSFMKPKTWSWQALSRVRDILIISGGGL